MKDLKKLQTEKLKKMADNLRERLVDVEYELRYRQRSCSHLYEYNGVGDPSIGGTMFSEWFACTKCGHERSIG